MGISETSVLAHRVISLVRGKCVAFDGIADFNSNQIFEYTLQI
jgi:hypothetical protein